MPTFTDVLDELGGRAVLCPEAKNTGAGRAIADRLAQYCLERGPEPCYRVFLWGA